MASVPKHMARPDLWQRAEDVDESEVVINDELSIARGRVYQMSCDVKFYKKDCPKPLVRVNDMKRTKGVSHELILSVTRIVLAEDVRSVDFTEPVIDWFGNGKTLGARGPHQMLATNLTARVYARDIDYEVAVIQFAQEDRGIPPILDSQLWMRTDIRLNIDHVKLNRWVWKVDHSRCVPICKPDCGSHRFHDAADVTVLCMECDEWFHLECLQHRGDLMWFRQECPEMLPDHLLFQPIAAGPDDIENEDERMWSALLAMPIQRGHSTLAPLQPFSLEALLLRVHEQYEEGGIPENVKKWMRRQFKLTLTAHDEEEGREARRMLKQAIDLTLQKRSVYECPEGHVF